MGVMHHRHRRHRLLSVIVIISFIFFFFSFASAASSSKFLGGEERKSELQSSDTAVLNRIRRRLSGPGSSPPSCRTKCGSCIPCKPVHVPIQPGLSIPLEYYPEAWRCKCGNLFFMP